MKDLEAQLVQKLRDTGVALHKAMAERDALALRRHEPIAIVGIGCRFPGGADSPAAFWDLLDSGRDAVASLDARWSQVGSRPIDEAPRWAGLLAGDIDRFDAGFFGIAPREARSLDPQHRLLLEVAWEALEDAGIAPRRLEGRKAGVFVGACSSDYGHAVGRQPEAEKDAYSTTGNMLSVAAGRVSYSLALNGPSVTVDTACSSSLVALHLAMHSLRAEECEVAIAGGVNLIVAPETMDSLTRLKALSPDGRCRTFDAAANGFVRGEGCGLLVLKRRSDAERDGDRIWAFLRGSAVNQDGRSTGLTAPNVLAQESLLRDALKSARVEAKAISYVETHGTGTSLGDPIEVEALRSVLGGTGRRVVLGAAKTNVGHLEGAAGVVGVIKAALALRHGRIPRNINFRTQNPRIRLEGTGLELASAAVDWPRGEESRLCGVSSFGISGTNAHVILEEAPARATAQPATGPQIFVFSARSSGALAASPLPDAPLADVAYSLATTRGHLEQRAAVVASTADELRAGMASVLPAEKARGKLAFLFSGQGAQVVGMGKALHARWKVFRETFDAACALFDPALRDVMWGDAARLDQTGFTQPALFIFEVALAALWRSWGIVPELVCGHSIGEIAAAHVAGVMTLEDAARLVAARARLMQALPAGGAMLSIAAPEAEVAARLVAGACIAAVNGLAQVVVAGDRAAVQAVGKHFARTKELSVSHAFHSPHMDGMLEPFRAAIAGIGLQVPRLPLVSLAGDNVTQVDYWVRHVRQPVRFSDGLAALVKAGASTFVEVGPRATLLGLIEDESALRVASLRSGKDENESLLRALGAVFSAGAEVQFAGVFPEGGNRVDLPTYAWQRERHWIDVAAATRRETVLSLDTQPWLADHRVDGRVVVPGAAIAELVAEVAGPREIRALTFQSPILLDGEARVRTSVDGDAVKVERWDGTGWQLHATATLAEPTDVPARVDLDALRARIADEILDVYARFARMGLDYGPSFQGMRRLWRGDGEALSELAPGSRVALLDAAMQTTVGILGEERVLPFELGALAWYGGGGEPAWAHVRGGDVTILDAQGGVMARIDGLVMRPARTAVPLDGVHTISWQERPAVGPPGTVHVFDGESPLEEASRALAIVQELARRGEPTRATFVTRGLAAQSVWGLIRSARKERPELDLRLVDIENPDDEVGGSEPEVAWRGGKRMVPELRRAGPASGELVLDGTVLVTGGLGALGQHVARWLVARKCPHVVLASRHGGEAPEGTTVVEVDVSDRAALAALLATLPDLRGVIHAAGVLDDGVLLEQSPERLARVFAAKVDGARNLDELTRDRDLAFFVMFSSVAGLLGSAGQANYAAANSFLDGLAAHRRSLGRAAQSLAWGPWLAGGMADRLDAAQKARLARHGIGAWSPAEGIALLEDALRRPDAVLGLVRLVEKVETAPVKDVRSTIAEEVARVLAWNGVVPEDRPLSELGLDSLMAVELRNGLSRRLGRTLPATLAFDHPTVSALGRFLGAESQPAKAAAPVTSTNEPIAIVGMACRYPGGIVDPASYWRVLDGAVDAVGPMPGERWDVDALYDPDPDAPGKMTVRQGGFLGEVDRFDAAFFGIAPREAAALDPQQRLLLETSWEVLEHARVAPDSLAGSDTGVFVGLMYQDYAAIAGADLEALDGHVLTGSAGSTASGRLSYTLGLKGPSLTVDTACSSSLVTLHLACQALRRGECRAALAGGVALMLSPAVFVEFSRLRGLSPDGRCKSFAATADGVGWSEGCGMLVLKRLSDAEKDGDRILALVRGSAVNQDGRSNGLTAPNGPSQTEVIQRALADAGVAPAEVGYVECHGTGTSLGDPIEVQALGAAMGEREQPVVIGSVKSNLGHTQAAAGAAGIMKVILAFQNGRIPASLHFDAPSPHIPWSELPVSVAREPVTWPRGERPRIAGVSSFGISGTNAHVVLEEPPFADETPTVDDRAHLFLVSARSKKALGAQTVPTASADVAYSLASTRAAHDHRRAVVARTDAELTERLKSERSPIEPLGKLAFLFSGQGSQTLGMGRGLHAAFPVFRAAFVATLGLLDSCLLDVMWGEDAALLDQTGFTQPAIFAVQIALIALLRDWGVVPGVVAGHSIGEIAAAHVAGVFSLEDAARLIGARARLMQALPGQGGMLAVSAPESTVASFLREGTSIAAVNAAAQVVVAGDRGALHELAERLAQAGLRSRELRVSHAFHSAQMDGMLDAFAGEARKLRYAPPSLPLISSVTGCLAGDEIATPDYWVAQVRKPVRFADAVETLRGSTFVEIGPRPALLPLVGEGVATLRPGTPEDEAFLSAVGDLWTAGARIRYADPGRRVDLPTYPWDRKRHWVEARPASARDALRRLADRSDLSAAARAALPELLAALGGEDPMARWSYAVEWRHTSPQGKPTGPFRVIGEGLPSDPSARDVIHVTPTRVAALASLKEAATRGGRVWLVTRGAVSTGPADPLRAPEQAIAWGLGRAFALEHPEAWGGLIDLAPDAPLASVIPWLGGDEDQLALRGGDAFVPRLAARSLPPRRGFTTDCALVTGGLGGIGLHVARWLVEHGTRELILTSRRGGPVPAGLPATVVAVDVSDRAAMAAALAGRRVTAVFHAAGIADMTPLAELTSARLDEVLAAKVEGTRVLEELLDLPALDAFVCFSSISGVWGAGRQAAYAASNAFLDAWAASARARQIKALSIAWGPWQGEGLAGDKEREYLERRGLRMLPPPKALDALDRTLAAGTAHALIADVDWGPFRASLEAFRPRPLIAEIGRASAPEAEEPSQALLDELATLRPPERAARLGDWLAGECAAILGHADATELDVQRGFFDLGLDSLMAVRLAGRLKAFLGLRLSPAVIFAEPNLAALTARLLADLGFAEPQAEAPGPDEEAFEGSDDDVLRLIDAKYEEIA